MEDITLARDDFIQITNAIEFVLAKLAHAQGSADSYAARREEFKILQFPAIKNAPTVKDDKGINYHKEEVISQSAEKCIEKAIQFPTKKEKQKLLTVSLFKKRKRKNSYEARCMFNGKAISISARTTAELKERLRAYVEEFNQLNKPHFPNDKAEQPPQEEPKPLLFKDYAFEYLEVMKKDDVQKSWYSRQETRLRLHIFPLLGERPLAEITSFECKKVLETVRQKELFRTAEEVHSTLKQIFEFAQSDGVVSRNPMARIKFQHAERTHGRCLTMVEEAHLLSLAKGTRYECHVVLMLYAGLRPCECNSAYVNGDFIVANNAKRKNHKIELKHIPITPMMRPFIPLLLQQIPQLPSCALRNWFYDMDWDIHAYYCRHTFNTRLAKFKINKELRELAMGHKSDSVTHSYGQKIINAEAT